jgi:hypothetical protein
MDPIAYLDFDLLVEPLPGRSPGSYRVRVLASPSGQAQADIDASALPERVDSMMWEARDARSFGQELLSAVLAGEVHSCLLRSQDEARRQRAGLRIRLRLSDAPRLSGLPWEVLYDPSLKHFLALSAESPIVRYLDLPEPVQPLAAALPLSVLVMISSPDDYAPIDVEQQWSALNESLHDLVQGGLITVERLEAPTLAALQQQLRQASYHILHFVGHGAFGRVGVLILQDEQGHGRPVSGDELGTLLHDHRSLRLAFLCACEGARASEGDLFSGVAQSLVQQGIPAVVAMQFPISERAAMVLVHEFYAALCEGHPVDADLAEARKAVYALGDTVEWATPVLYMRSPDGGIFDLRRPSASTQERVSQGLTALSELMQMSEVRAAVVTFCADFGAACQQIDVLSDHKQVHDLLHTMQIHCYHPIVQEAKRFPTDDMALDNLMDYELTLQGIVRDLQRAAEQESLASFEMSWIAELDRARQELHDALEDLEPQLLKRAVWRLKRVLAIQPSQVNTRLNDAARALRLPDLLHTLTAVRDHLATLDLDRGKVHQFQAGVEALNKLNQALAELVESHDRWQVVDLELRRIEAAMGQDTMELEMSWPSLQELVEPLIDVDREWTEGLRASTKALTEAIGQENPAKIRRSFWRYRRQAVDRFYRVDVDLKNLCEDLRQVGDPLNSVMDMIGH